MKGMRIVYDGSDGIKADMEKALRDTLKNHGLEFSGSGMAMMGEWERDMIFDLENKISIEQGGTQ